MAQGYEHESDRFDTDSEYLKEVNEQKEELLQKVQLLKQDLQDWRSKLDQQVRSYKTEISDLRQALNGEVDTLKSEFMELKAALKQQLELTASLSAQATGGTNANAASPALGARP